MNDSPSQLQPAAVTMDPTRFSSVDSVRRHIKRALVTGDAGFTGRHLVTYLQSEGYSVSGFSRSRGDDIRDAATVTSVLRANQPEVVFHLAAAPKAADAREHYSVNILGTVALLDAILTLEQAPVVVIVSSSAVYGRTPDGRAVSERMQPRPLTHYGASKLAQELVAMRYMNAHAVPVIVARAFNLVGPGMPKDLACGAFVDSIVKLERSKSDGPIRTGNLNSSRDFTDVRDGVRAYAALAEQGRPGLVYNVCSGRAVSLEYCLQVLTELAVSPMRTELDPARLQADDLAVQVGDGRRLRARTDWRPLISLEQSLADTLDYRRQEPSR